jgi:hypothetical protein
MILRSAVVLIALLVSSAAQAGYMTYQKWSDMPEVYRVAYIAGVFDTTVTSWADDKKISAFKAYYSECITAAGMTDIQLAANVLAFAKGKPEFHTGTVPVVLAAYLVAACGAPSNK